ncbi:MAG: heme ABC exporter ATP-binding protein CcmA [Rickettsiaceae bacterium]|nr:heme ABC exporter ATP-binding protein CcmA [Rickettsiaceae bacterium]
MLLLNNIRINVNNKTLIENLSVSILPGSITYVTGKNGSGKTTLLKTLANLKKPSKGEIKLYNHTLEELQKPYCLYLGHKQGLEDSQTVLEHLKFWSKCYHSLEMVISAIKFWDLEDILEKDISELSEGQKRRVTLSKLTLCHSKLWLLDEVEVNLDQEILKFLHYAITIKANSGSIIFLATNTKERIKFSQQINIEDYL